MKILLLTYEYPPFKGGIATYLANLVAAAPKDVEIVVDVPRQGEHWIQTIWRLCRQPSKKKPDLMAISHVLPAGYVAFNSLFWYKTPYLVFTHGTDILSARQNAWKRFWLRFILKRAKYVIANSRFTAGLLKEEGIVQIEIIPPSVVIPERTSGIQSSQTADREGLDSHLRGNDIISIGRLVPRKGFDTLIKAMPSVIKEIPNTHLTIIGRGAYYDELVRLAHELRVEKFVEILTDLDDAAKEQALRQAALFALAARQIGNDIEGFGIVTLEASANGLPVVVVSSGGAAEPVVSGTTGFVLPTDDLVALSQTLVELLKNKDKAEKMGAAGRDYVAKEYSVEVIAKRFWSIVIPNRSEGSQRL